MVAGATRVVEWGSFDGTLRQAQFGTWKRERKKRLKQKIDTRVSPAVCQESKLPYTVMERHRMVPCPMRTPWAPPISTQFRLFTGLGQANHQPRRSRPSSRIVFASRCRVAGLRLSRDSLSLSLQSTPGLSTPPYFPPLEDPSPSCHSFTYAFIVQPLGSLCALQETSRASCRP